MISKDQANSIADQLLDQQRAEMQHTRNVAASRVPYFYRCKELRQLEPWQRAEVIREARRSFRDDWWSFASMVAWGLMFGTFWFFLVPVAIRISFLFWGELMFILPPILLRISLLRLHVRYLARLRQCSSNG